MILIPALLAPLAGFLVSYVFPAKYTSQSLVLVEAPQIPDAMVQQVFTANFTQQIAIIQQRVLSSARLRPMDLKSRQDASQNLNDMDKKLAAFKNQHMGQLQHKT